MQSFVLDKKSAHPAGDAATHSKNAHLRLHGVGVGQRHAHVGAHMLEHAAAPQSPAGAATPKVAAVAATPFAQHPAMQAV